MFFLLIEARFYSQSEIFLLSIKTCYPPGHFALVAALTVWLTNSSSSMLTNKLSLMLCLTTCLCHAGASLCPSIRFLHCFIHQKSTAFYITWLQICQRQKKGGEEKKRKKRQQKQFCQMINFCLLSMFNVTQGCKCVCLLDSKKNDRKFLTCNKSARLGLTKVQCYQDYQSICNDML